jgi:hypothetical protein
MARPGNKKIDALLMLARTSIAERRRRSPFRLLAVVAVLALLIGLLIWVLWPAPGLPRLMLAAYDQVALPGEEVELCAGVEPADTPKGEAGLAHCDLYFEEKNPEQVVKCQTDDAGRASLTIRAPEKAGTVLVAVRYPGEKDRRRGAQAAPARLYVWPPDTQLLIVDADSALADVKDDRFWTTNNLDVPPLKDALATLQQLQARYRIVFLSSNVDRPKRHAKLRSWLEKWPDGPLLGRACHSNDSDPSEFKEQRIAGLRKRFPGSALGVTRQLEEAKLYQAAGLKTFLIGDNVLPTPGITLVKSWKDVGR